MLNKISFDIFEWLMILADSIQYSFLYSIFGIPFAYYNNRLFSPLDKNKSIHKIFYEIIMHIIVMAIFFYFMKLIVQKIPFIFSSLGYIPRSDEYFGNAVGAFIIFFYLQIYLTDKLSYIADELFRKNIFWETLFFI